MTKINDTQLDKWEVFIQSKSGQPYLHAGTIHASDAKMAIQNARDTYTRRGEGTSIWVVPSNYIISTNPDDADMLFDPSFEKTFRHPTFYEMPEGAKNI